MKNYLFISDLHIIESEIEEVNSIFDELSILIDKYNITHIFNCGDSFDKVYPTIPELKCFANWIKKINKPIVIISANSHESVSQTLSILDLFGILKDTANIVKEYHDENKLYCGHFIMNQSSKNFGGTVDSKTLKQYRYVILGHGHNHEMSKENWCQLGSIRYVDFGEDPKIKKVVGVCLDYESDRPKWLWIPLNSCYPMVNLNLGKNIDLDPSKMTLNSKSSISQAQDSLKTGHFEALSDLSAYLDKLDPKTKVRVIFKDYGLWREFLPLSETYKNKFFKFVEKKDFLISANSEISHSKETSSLKDSLIKFLESNKVPTEIKNILLGEL